MRPARFRTAATAVLLTGALTGALVGCGASSAEDPEPAAAGDPAEATTEAEEEPESAEPEPSEEPAPVTVARAPFCDGLDQALVEEALGAPSQWLEQRRPGEEYQPPIGDPMKEDDFFCKWQTNKESADYGPGDATFVVTVRGKPVVGAKAEAALTEARDFAKALGCEELSLTLGDQSYARACETKKDRYNDAAASATILATFGDVLVTCFVQRMGPDQVDTVSSTLEEVCTQVPEALAS